MAIIAKRYDKDAYRLHDGEQIVAFALRLANGRWGRFDANETRLDKTGYKTPEAVAAAHTEALSQAAALPSEEPSP